MGGMGGIKSSIFRALQNSLRIGALLGMVEELVGEGVQELLDLFFLWPVTLVLSRF